MTARLRALVVTLVLLAACGDGEDRPGQVTSETDDGATPTATATP